MTFKRARVAITAAVGEGEIGRIHIGHARTVLAGSLIAQEKGCPFHVRIDGTRPDDVGQATADFVLDLRNLLDFIGIECRLYFYLERRLPLEAVASLTGLTASRLEAYRLLAQIIGDQEVRLAAVEDDAILHAPSLIIRGAEFVDPGRWSPPGAAGGMSTQVLYEDCIYAFLGIEKHELNLPLVLASGHKMSKSMVNGIGWEVLTMVSPDQARRYLIASLLDPVDPLSVLDDEFSESRISSVHHEWSWDTWARFAKQP